MTEQVKYSQDKIEAIAQKLRAMPPVEKKKQLHSRLETVKMLRGEISAMQKRGYSLDQISEALREEGLDILTPTLKNYLQRVKNSGAKKKIEPRGQRQPQEKPSTKRPPGTPKASKATSESKASFTVRPDTDDI